MVDKKHKDMKNEAKAAGQFPDGVKWSLCFDNKMDIFEKI